ncbi:MAG: histidinol-phosphate transaminase [Kiritimatiellae bacterium]|nr:histidinol-phosphate transaminase [Kiritimatiellia bacterium]
MNTPVPNPRIRRSVASLEAYVPGEQPKVKGLIKLNTNENPYPPSPRVAEALRDVVAADLRLYPDPTCLALRTRLGELHGVDPAQIFVGNGSDEVLRLATRAFTQEHGQAAMFDPSYSLYPVLCAAEEVRMAKVPLADDFSWRNPLPELPPDTSLFFLTNPNAPTGVLYPRPAIEAFAAAFPGTLLIDEAYADFTDTPSDYAAFAAAAPNVLDCHTFSKSWSLAGLRCGYAIGSPDLVGALYQLKDSYNLDRVAQTLALAALSDVDWMRANAARIRATRTRVATELLRRDFTVTPSQSNFLFVRPPAPATAAGLFARLREKNILVRHFPASPRTAPFLRVSIGTDEQMDLFLQALAED